MPRKSRQEEIVKLIRAYLAGAVKRLEPITDGRVMEAARCARATFYKYVTKGSEVDLEIEAAREKQKKYAELMKRGDCSGLDELNMHKRLEEAENGNRELLAFIARMTANLMTCGVPSDVIQRAQREDMPHPNRSYSHAGRWHHRH